MVGHGSVAHSPCVCICVHCMLAAFVRSIIRLPSVIHVCPQTRCHPYCGLKAAAGYTFVAKDAPERSNGVNRTVLCPRHSPNCRPRGKAPARTRVGGMRAVRKRRKPTCERKPSQQPRQENTVSLLSDDGDDDDDDDANHNDEVVVSPIRPARIHGCRMQLVASNLSAPQRSRLRAFAAAVGASLHAGLSATTT